MFSVIQVNELVSSARNSSTGFFFVFIFFKEIQLIYFKLKENRLERRFIFQRGNDP